MQSCELNSLNSACKILPLRIHKTSNSANTLTQIGCQQIPCNASLSAASWSTKSQFGDVISNSNCIITAMQDTEGTSMAFLFQNVVPEVFA
ncbi:hypothetical protein AKJ16_DCAP21261 [Drosera capensis]